MISFSVSFTGLMRHSLQRTATLALSIPTLSATHNPPLATQPNAASTGCQVPCALLRHPNHSKKEKNRAQDSGWSKTNHHLPKGFIFNGIDITLEELSEFRFDNVSYYIIKNPVKITVNRVYLSVRMKL